MDMVVDYFDLKRRINEKQNLKMDSPKRSILVVKEGIQYTEENNISPFLHVLFGSQRYLGLYFF
jgi:hypothetical protein